MSRLVPLCKFDRDEASEGDLNLLTGEVTNFHVSVLVTQSGIQAVAGAKPKLGIPIFRYPGGYGDAWVEFEQRADGLLDFTIRLSTFLPLGGDIGGDPVRFPVLPCLLSFAKTSSESEAIDFPTRSLHNRPTMLSAIFSCFRLASLLFGGHRAVALENLALRQPLALLTRTSKGPQLRRRDRLFWIWLAKFWKGWKSVLRIVQPKTALRWQRRRFQLSWRHLSQHKDPGRPKGSAEIRSLVTKMATANALWGAPRIHGGY